MVTFWSETPGRRWREVAADVSTWAWVALWSVVAFRIHTAIAGYAEAGHALERGGAAIRDAGVQVGSSLDGVPLIGAGAGELARRAFGGASEPFVFVGGEFVDLITLIARVLALLILAVALIPWLSRYLPWRAARLAELRSATTAIRRRPSGVTLESIDRLLASRALHRLSWAELLDHSRDPLGEFAAGRYKALAKAELESVGLRPR
ncbi:MAG TPA: hypothetical protein VN773_12250 [Verrucomicrobiae bacterium]|jgi:hypothetical protein|nr:hypothetical protein [Verrucomicrobiae bacterium]